LGKIRTGLRIKDMLRKSGQIRTKKKYQENQENQDTCEAWLTAESDDLASKIIL
jgi:hypothetical protein